jgi:hypothetical protein
MNGMSWEGGHPHTGVPEIVSPLPNSFHSLEINVDLTPFILTSFKSLNS